MHYCFSQTCASKRSGRQTLAGTRNIVGDARFRSHEGVPHFCRPQLMLHETQKDPKVQTQFMRLVEIHHAYLLRGKNSGNKFHQFLGSRLGVVLVKVKRHFNGIKTGGWLVVSPSGRTAFEGIAFKVFHLRFELPIC